MYERIELPGTRIQLTLQRRQDGLERLATPITLSLEDLDGLTEDKVKVPIKVDKPRLPA